MADVKKPYGDVQYADPGYQADGKKRYPIDTEAHCRAAWSYINQADNAKKYTPEQVSAIKGRIKAAGKKYGITFESDSASRSETPPSEMLLPVRPCSRTYQLEDMTVRSDGSGRVVESYFAVFAPIRSEVMDQDGHYHEENSPGLFAKTLRERGLNIPVFYNHARTLDGTPSGELSIPVGKPLEIRTDERGVFNAVRYLDNPLADSVLNGIHNKVINGMSFSGRYIKSARSYPQGRGRGRLPLIVRQEADIREFGPTAVPQFPEAAILGTRAQQTLRMLQLLQGGFAPDEAASFVNQFEGLTTLDAEPEAPPSDTSEQTEAVEQAEEPQKHSARSIPLSTRVRAARIARGWE